DVGLVHFNRKVSTESAMPDPASTPTLVAKAPIVADLSTQDTVVAPLFPSASTPPRPPEAPLQSDVAAAAHGRCPKLGFEDDPTSAFGRPTRLHRCFAAGAPMPLALDQQRELCLSDHFGTCPHLTAAPASSAPRGARPGARPVESPTQAATRNNA